MQFCQILSLKLAQKKSKLEQECYTTRHRQPHTTSHRSCLLIQPAVEAKEFVHVAGTEWCTLLI